MCAGILATWVAMQTTSPNQLDNDAIAKQVAWGNSLSLESTPLPAGSVLKHIVPAFGTFIGVDIGKLPDVSFLVKVEKRPDGTIKVIQGTPVRAVHFILKSVWFEQTKDGTKNVEYRPVTPRWTAILSKNPNVAIFSRGYTKIGRVVRVIEKIDVGPCPIPHWSGDYYRIHLAPKETTFIG